MRGTLAMVALTGTLLATLPGQLAPAQATPPTHPRSVLVCNPTVSNVGTDVVLTFDDTTPGGCQWTPPAWMTSVRVLVVGGGGGGGVNGRGGGGGGGVQEEASYAVSSTVTITVGAGGSGAYYGPGYTGWWHNQYDNTVRATNGGSSSFGSLTSLGGGFGSGCYGSAGILDAGSGGSGGGAAGCVAGAGTVGQGYDGSNGGGGGGAGSAGSAGSGGAGKSSDITGVTLGYGGGGGVGTIGNPPGGSADVGDGGGRGGSNAYRPDAGVNGRGGGGGGGGYFPDGGRAPDFSNDTSIGARGGNGVVIVRYSKGTQSITAVATPNPVLKNRQAALSATDYSGTGAVTYAVAPGDTNCSIAGAVLTALQVGTCTITATIADDSYYLGATSAPLTVTVLLRYPQTITAVATPNPVRVVRQATLSAIGYTGTGAITYAVATGGTNCSIAGTILTALQVGTCTITATIAEDSTYLAATSAPLTVTVLPRLAQTITVKATPTSAYVPGTIALSAEGYSGTGAITYAVATGGGICSIGGSTLTISQAGTCTVTATIAQDDTYAAATSAPVTVTGSPPPTPPGPPYLTAVRTGNRQLSVDWTRPDYDGTSPITEYRVYAAPGGQVCTVKASGQIYSTCLVKDLTNGKPYEFWVTAVNGVGESQPSRRLTGTPRPDLPSPPIFTSLRPGNEQATASWNPPSSDGGGTISEYRVYSYAGTRLCTVKASAGPPYSCVITGLKNSTSYQMRVTAVNESGEGPPSTWLSAIPNPVRPGVPQDVTARAGNFRINAAWNPPADEGTYPVESYQVWLEGIGAVCTVTAPDTSCEIPNLVPGQTYRVQVRAWSKAGWGNLSNVYPPVVTVPAPNIGYPEVRRNRKDPTRMTVTIGTTGIKPGTRLYTLPPMTGDEYDRPVVGEDGVAIWKAIVPLNEVWYVVWCTDSRAQGLCSPRTLLIDPYFSP